MSTTSPSGPLSAAPAERPKAYLRLLMALLIPAALFDSYDGELRALLLHNIQQTFHVGVSALGLVNVPIQAGQFIAFFLVARSDRVGRRPVLLWSVLGSTLFTALTAFSWNLWSFTTFQFAAQICIGAEFGVAVTLVAEEFSAVDRGRALARLLLFSPLGAVLGGVLLAGGMDHTPLGWRGFFLVSLLPLGILAVARRHLQESRVLVARRAHDALSAHRHQHQLREEPGRGPISRSFAVWQRPWGARLAAVGTMALLQGIAATAAIGWWTYYAEQQRHLPSALAGAFFATATAVSLAGYVTCGWAIDRYGRRPTTAAYITAAVGFGYATFSVSSPLWLAVTLIGMAFFGVGIAPAMSALTAELFPTALRGHASAWIRNGFGNVGSVLGPALVGVLSAPHRFRVPVLEGTGVGGAARLLVVLALPIVVIIWRWVPETKGTALSDIEVSDLAVGDIEVPPRTSPDGGRQLQAPQGGDANRAHPAAPDHLTAPRKWAEP